MAETKISVIVDNHAIAGLSSEHGLAIHLQIDDHSILFDTGQGPVLTANAAASGIKLVDIRTLVLSHGHYDHTGGIPELSAVNHDVQVYYHLDATNKRYSLHPGQPAKDISMPDASRQALYQLPLKNLHHLLGPCKLFSQVWITGEIPRWHDFEDTGGPFFLDRQGLRPDSIADDMALWINTQQGLVIVLGCCHSGLISTVEYIQQISGIRKIHGIIGGMHLLHASPERLEKTCDQLYKWSPDWLIPCHCTGDATVIAIVARLGEKVISSYAGLTVKI